MLLVAYELTMQYNPAPLGPILPKVTIRNPLQPLKIARGVESYFDLQNHYSAIELRQPA
jgi:hypothetical protein